VAAAAPSPELGAIHCDDLDARVSQPVVRVFVPRVCHDQAWLNRQEVVAVVPLLTFGLNLVPPRFRSPVGSPLRRDLNGH